MNDVVANNVRYLREQRGWSQEQLAETAGVAARTVQRVETGRGSSGETLMAIANAFGLSVEALRTNRTGSDARLEELAALGIAAEDLADPDAIARRFEDFKARHTLLPIQNVTCAADLRVIGEVDAQCFECIPRDDATQAAGAELNQMLRDVADLWHQLEAPQQWEMLRDCYERVTRLESMGADVAFVVQERCLHGGGLTSPFPLKVLYTIVAARADRPLIAALPKSTQVRLG